MSADRRSATASLSHDGCASREACRRAPTGGKSHQTREPWHLSCQGGNSAANRLSLKRPRAHRARCGVQGGERKRASCGCNRRRRLATGSRQPKRGFGTAVPKTTIEVADHCPLREPRGPSSSGDLGANPKQLCPTPRALWARCGVQGVTPCPARCRCHRLESRP